MPSFRTGVVTGIRAERVGLQKVEVDGEPAYVLTQLIGTVAVGDRVVINTTAVDLGLGTGGWHFVHWNLARESWSEAGGGTVMKLRYTSLQVDTGAAEEDGAPPDLAMSLDGRPVVACTLHSQVAGVAAGFARGAPGRRLVYVMTDSAALPLAVSDLVADLRGRGLLASTVTCGQAFGGDDEAVSVPSALQVAAVVARADAIVVGPGPGVVGTGSEYGFGGVEVAVVVDVAAHLGGRPIVAVRYSDADRRDRHRGVSHHTTTALALAGCRPGVAVPRGTDGHGGLDGLGDVVEVDVPDDLDFGVATSMGRGPAQDPGFFRWAAAAGMLAGRLLG
ncbi:MAG TPA: DUF3866 family protein [Acidimicrobiales bacterium]|nr:DUF3866 family protein [Acidimicrobiales bacterium]